MKKKSIILFIVAIIFFVGCLSYYIFYRYTGIMIPCLFHKLTGYYCPGCGITRCIFALFRFDFKTAIHNNLLVVVYFFIFLFYYLYRLFIYIKNIKRPRRVEIFVLSLLLVIAILFGIVRNLPGFEYLVPLIYNI